MFDFLVGHDYQHECNTLQTIVIIDYGFMFDSLIEYE